MNNQKVIIIGAGLTGLMLAYILKQKGLQSLILEANSRIGGRIDTITGSTGVTLEMGATWFGKQHPTLVALLDNLGLSYFKQHTKGTSLFETMSFVPPQKFEIPDAEEPSYRIEGGTTILIKELTNAVGLKNIKTNAQVVSIKEIGQHLEIRDADGNRYLADKVITTLPPHLLIQTVIFEPNLPEALVQLAKKTHTWMGESIKFAVEYANPFWKENRFSGTLFSHASIAQEMYDHCSFDNTGFALKGFLNAGSYTLTAAEREEKVIKQLRSLYGPKAETYVAYHEKVWREEVLTFLPSEELVMAHQNNGHPDYKKPFLNNKLYISGAETASINPGYMDGALNAAHYIAAQF
jgi:monoamine oxidase